MKILFTKHAEKKFKDLEKLGIKVTKLKVEKILLFPNTVDEEFDHPNIIASGKLNIRHILRVVYRKNDDIITVITFYPTNKERYRI